MTNWRKYGNQNLDDSSRRWIGIVFLIAAVAMVIFMVFGYNYPLYLGESEYSLPLESATIYKLIADGISIFDGSIPGVLLLVLFVISILMILLGAVNSLWAKGGAVLYLISYLIAIFAPMTYPLKIYITTVNVPISFIDPANSGSIATPILVLVITLAMILIGAWQLSSSKNED